MALGDLSPAQSIELRVGIRMNPWGGIQHMANPARHEACNRTQHFRPVPQFPREGAVERKIPLRALDDRTIRHHPRVAHAAGIDADFDLAFCPDDIAVKRQRSVLR